MGHPILPVLRSHFKACSEEYGETAIHTLMTHIREWNYSGENMKKRWQESNAATWCFQQTGIPRSHRTSGTKWHHLDDPSDDMILLSEKFVLLVEDAKHGVLEKLVGNPGFSRDCERSEDLSYWEELPELHEMSFTVASEQVFNLEEKIRKPLDRSMMLGIDMDLFYS